MADAARTLSKFLSLCRADDPLIGFVHDQVGIHMACQAVQTLGAGKSLTGLDPSDVSLELCLCTSRFLFVLYGVLEEGWRLPLQVLGSLQG